MCNDRNACNMVGKVMIGKVGALIIIVTAAFIISMVSGLLCKCGVISIDKFSVVTYSFTVIVMLASVCMLVFMVLK